MANAFFNLKTRSVLAMTRLQLGYYLLCLAIFESTVIASIAVWFSLHNTNVKWCIAFPSWSFAIKIYNFLSLVWSRISWFIVVRWIVFPFIHITWTYWYFLFRKKRTYPLFHYSCIPGSLSTIFSKQLKILFLSGHILVFQLDLPFVKM